MVCAVQGICTAGAFYFVNEADIVICSPEATFFDSHVTYGMVSALEPVGLMRRIGLGETLRMALLGNDERVGAETALRIGLVTEIVARAALWDRAHEIAARDRRQADRGDAGHGARHLGVARPALPRRDGAGPDLHAGRQPDRDGRGRRAPAREARPEDPLTARGASALSERIAAIAKLDPAAPALEFDGRWYTWGELDATISSVGALVPAPGAQVGIILRNRPAHVGALLGVLRAGGCVVTINPHRGLARTRDDIAALGLGIVVGSEEDLRELVVAPGVRTTVRAARARRSAGRDASTGSSRPTRRGCPASRSACSRAAPPGPPKRIELSFDLLERVLLGAKYYERDKAASLRLRSGVAIVNSPLVHLGGVFRILQCVNDGRSFCLLERFSVDGWYDAVRRHRPQTASLVPAALRMVLEADLDPAELSSIRSVVCGTAPLDPDDADAFFERYGIPGAHLVRAPPSSAAASRAGTSPTTQKFWATKRGSVGRAHPGCELRVVDEEDGRVLGADEAGSARGEGRPARRTRVDAHDRPRADRRRRLPVDPRTRRSGDHPRRLQGPSRRRAARARTASRRARRQP